MDEEPMMIMPAAAVPRGEQPGEQGPQHHHHDENDLVDDDDRGRRILVAAAENRLDHHNENAAVEEAEHHHQPVDDDDDDPAPCIILSINGLTLDLTNWARHHPGGPELLRRYHGRDASKIFRAAGHSDAAHSMLLEFSVGGPPVESRPQAAALILMLMRRGILTTTGYHVLIYLLRLVSVLLEGTWQFMISISSSLDLLGLFGVAAVTYQLRRMGVGKVYLWIPTIVAVLNCRKD